MEITTEELNEGVRKLNEHLRSIVPEPKLDAVIHHRTHVEIRGTLSVLMSHDTYRTLLKHPKLI